MRSQEDECSFVSLRDIERVIQVASWFLNNERLLAERITERHLAGIDDAYQANLSWLRRSIVLALCVCYHACLYTKDTRFRYRKMVAETAPIPDMDEGYSLQNDWVLYEILKCQHVFLDQVRQHDAYLNKLNRTFF